MKLKEKIIEIISSHCDMNNTNQYLHENDDLTKIGLNSILFIKIVVDLESELQFEFEDEALDYNKFTSLNLLCSYVEEQMKINHVEYYHKEKKVNEDEIKEWLMERVAEITGFSNLNIAAIYDLSALNISLDDARRLVDDICKKFNIYMDEDIIKNEKLFIVENLCRYLSQVEN